MTDRLMHLGFSGSRPPSMEWASAAERVLSHWRHLDTQQVTRLIQQAWELDRTRRWEGLDGFSVTPHVRASISALACLLTVNIGLRMLTDVTGIIVAPTSVNRTTSHRVGGGMVGESFACVLGVSLLHGPVRLSWDRIATEEGSWSSSVVIHEFAHKIDMADGCVSGTPPIADHEQARHFELVLEDTLARLHDGDDPDPLSDYAGTNAAELFAVSTEAFFLKPDRLRTRYSDLFDVLESFYQQRPLVIQWSAPGSSG